MCAQPAPADNAARIRADATVARAEVVAFPIMLTRSERGNTRITIVVAILVAAALLAFYLATSRRTPEPAPKPAAATAPAPKAEKPAPPVEVPKPEPAPAPRRRAPKPEPKPEPPPPVETAPTTGTLRIDSDVPGATVFIDRVYLGTTPVTAKDLTPGRHKLNASVTGQEGISEPIEVEVGEHDLMIRFKEVRLDATLAVVHKHGMGSCRGKLVATPQGLRYETTNKGDAFTSPLTTLEIFEVDYLKKNLRIKPKGGKTYTFTDPEDNADRLFVFHRDVDKARQRLTQQ